MMRLSKVLGVLVIVAIAVVVLAGIGINAPGPEQPVPFSHRVHAGTKQISCFFCHPNAMHSSNAGLPPVEKCILCHKVIASNFPPIKKARDYFDRKQPIPWVRVTQVPDFVQFNHQPHLARGFDCSRCHGDVKKMDRITLANKIDMGFCVRCHWRNKFTVVCYTCHY